MEQAIKVLDFLDGNLLPFLRQTLLINAIKKNGLIRINGLENSEIAKLIVDARDSDISWVWSISEIYQDESTGEWCLPSVDLNGFFDWSGNDSIETWLKNVKKIEFNCNWDTEYSAWYPKFNNKIDATKCIAIFDTLFDDQYLELMKYYSTLL